MPWAHHSTWHGTPRRAVQRLLACLWLLACLPVWAQSVESVFSPGPLAKAHARWDNNCRACHVPFERQAQDRLCADCHKDIGRDLARHGGFHGRLAAQSCRSCHTEHRGRDMEIVRFEPRKFDHRQSDFELRGKHRETGCAKCHQPERKYRAAPHDCNSCHRDKDVHKAAFGADCARCHGETSWRETRFDHAATRFALTGAHAKAKCETCHKAGDPKDAPQACIGCHRQEDRHKGQYGDKCEGCHNTVKWPQVTFRHDVDTKFALRARHRELKCIACHTGVMYRDKLGSACIDCHRKDDRHRGTLGADCASCHTERNWTESKGFDHERTDFALRGRHARVPCKECHLSPVFKEAARECIACHRKVDRHEGTLGERCAACHDEQNWKATRFDHARTRFVLRGGHAAERIRCTACHRDQRSYRDTPLQCDSCHHQDDKHEGQLGADCAACHDEQRWKGAPFDHARSRFALAGAHVRVACASCHQTPRFRDAPRECAACHQKADVHKGSLGAACESCHNVRDWRLWRFSHDRQSTYLLAGAHAKVRCAACHTAPAPAGRPIAAVGRECIACHAKDDEHERAYGTRCEQCHQPTRWKEITNRRLPAAGGERP